jgi:hypothetical protein
MKCAVKQRLLRMREPLRNKRFQQKRKRQELQRIQLNAKAKLIKGKSAYGCAIIKQVAIFTRPLLCGEKISENQYLRLLQKDQRLTSKTLKPMLVNVGCFVLMKILNLN